MKGKGWYGEPGRHSLAAKGVRTGRRTMRRPLRPGRLSLKEKETIKDFPEVIFMTLEEVGNEKVKEAAFDALGDFGNLSQSPTPRRTERLLIGLMRAMDVLEEAKEEDAAASLGDLAHDLDRMLNPVEVR